MKKLQLRLDDIDVASFDAAPSQAQRLGTVKGADALTRITQCDPNDTCFFSCNLSQCTDC